MATGRGLIDPAAGYIDPAQVDAYAGVALGSGLVGAVQYIPAGGGWRQLEAAGGVRTYDSCIQEFDSSAHTRRIDLRKRRKSGPGPTHGRPHCARPNKSTQESPPHRRARMVEWTTQAEGVVGVTGALFRRGVESDDPGAIVEAARYDSAVIV
ncbi:hypothetical protein VE02_00442 [Pseudogymnoascus sp. 03VT05]|nr:hypothetical protein VE02_00442 [Pseudogymnoascus sp. 03VT05]